jgi:hypothetical protein
MNRVEQSSDAPPGASGGTRTAPAADAPAPAFDAKAFVDALPSRPGVYRMLDAQGTILYVGKARNLKSRVGSYFQPSNVQPKVQALVAKTANMEVTITNRGAAARVQPHQEAPAAVQRRAAR